MKRASLWRAVVCLLALYLLAPGLCAELTPDQTRAAQALLARFSSPEFAVRQEAVDKLVAMGGDVAPLVRKTLAETADNEVKLRCQMVLKALEAGGPTTPKDKPNYDGSRITLEAKGMPLAEAMRLIAEQSGNHPVKINGVEKRTVTASLKDVPYWQALDALCRSSGTMRESYILDNNGLMTYLHPSGGDAPTYCAYSGPAAVELSLIERASSEQRYLPAYGHPPTKPEKKRLIRFYTMYVVEDRLPLLGARIQFTKALTPLGENILPKFRQYRGGYSIPECFIRDTPPIVDITDPPEDIEGPLTLEGSLHLWLAVGRKELRIEKVFAGEKKAVEAPGVSITLLSVMKTGNQATLGLQLKMDPAKGPILVRDFAPFGFALMDAAGKYYGRMGGWNITKRGPEGITMTFNITEVPPDTDQLALVYVYPEGIDEKDYTFTIKDVPIP